MTHRRHLAVCTLAVAAALASLNVAADAQEAQARAQADALVAPKVGVDPSPAAVADVMRQTGDSLVVVKYVWDGEAARRELEGIGVVVRADGLVAASLDMMPTVLPDAQLKEFQILVPTRDGDPIEVKAVLVARDERTGLIFLRPDAEEASSQPTTQPTTAEAATEPAADVQWKPAAFGSESPSIGDYVLSVGRLPEGAGYQPYVNVARVSTTAARPDAAGGRGSQSLTGAGSVVVDRLDASRVIGFIESDRPQLAAVPDRGHEPDGNCSAEGQTSSCRSSITS